MLQRCGIAEYKVRIVLSWLNYDPTKVAASCGVLRLTITEATANVGQSEVKKHFLM